MRRFIVLTLLSTVVAAGCATGSGSPSAAGNAAKAPGRDRPVEAQGAATGSRAGTLPPATPPRPQPPASSPTVSAGELQALRLTRPAPLRQQPASGAPRFGALKVDDLVLRLDARGPWYRVWVPAVALSGWIERGTAVPVRGPVPASMSPVPVVELSTVTVRRPGVRLRSAPSVKSAALRTLAQGEALRLVAEEGSWVKVYDPAANVTGYVAGRLVERAR